MHSNKIEAGSEFPNLFAKGLDGMEVDISKPRGESEWQLLVVYRGRHCPLCTKYLNQLESFVQSLSDINVDLAAVSADSKDQLAEHLDRLTVSFPLYYGLSIQQMQLLGLYISNPRSEKETDHQFPEPGLFAINSNRQVQVVDISNNPFVRPELESLVSGLAWIRNPENNYPIRGTYK
jgi:peroxiredoxin